MKAEIAMNTGKTTCILCHHEIPTSYLRAHREHEMREIVEYTIDMIKGRHPEWTENDPTCQKCWDYYQTIPTK